MSHLETQVLEQLRTLPTDKQHQVLVFVEFLVAQAKQQLPAQGAPFAPTPLSTQSMQSDPFVATQRLRESIQVQGEPLSASIIQQRHEARY